MKRIAIIGAGICGLTAAYELEQHRKAGADIEWTLYESTNRLGGIIQTTRKNGFILEHGPDGWVTEKPWARDLAIELGLESQLIYSNDATRKTYILIDKKLQPMPDRMRMMVPEDLSTLEASPLFSPAARAAYAAELDRSDELRASAPTQDESIATFVRRHFGDEVLNKIAAPLLSGIFGGDVELLSVRAIMPQFVAMEKEFGSLIAAVQNKARTGPTPKPIFTSLRDGVASLIEALVAKLPPEHIQLDRPVLSLKREGNQWCVRTAKGSGKTKKHFHQILLATPTDTTRNLLHSVDAISAAFLPKNSSSALLISFCFPPDKPNRIILPQGFGFLVPQTPEKTQLMACTFSHQKFTQPLQNLRAFYGGTAAEVLQNTPNPELASLAFSELQTILGPLPEPDPDLTTITRWPRSLPQYEVGHVERIAQLDERMKSLKGLSLLGNSYRGVGLPDLIRDARAAAVAALA